MTLVDLDLRRRMVLGVSCCSISLDTSGVFPCRDLARDQEGRLVAVAGAEVFIQLGWGHPVPEVSKQQGEAVRCSKEQVQPAHTMVSDERADQVAGAYRGRRGVGAGGDHSAAWARREGHGSLATHMGDGC